MASITHEQIDFILDDITKRGVVLEDLQDNLLDHVCCIVEYEMPEGEDFYKFYERILPRFFKTELKELQEETDQLLTFKDYYAMKNTLKTTGIASSLLILVGAILKTLHLPGAGISLVLGGTIFSLIFLPLMIILKFKDEESTTDKLVLSLGFLLGMSVSAGVLFKIMHWPGANIMMLGGIIAFVFGYVPLYFFTRIRRADLKFNTIVNSVLMMACGGLLFSMFNLGYSHKTKQSFAATHSYVEYNSVSLFEANDELFNSLQPTEEAKTLHQASANLHEKIEDIKLNLIAITEGISVDAAKGYAISNLSRPNDFDMVNHHFVNANSELSLSALQNDIDAYNKVVSTLFSSESEKLIAKDKLQLNEVMLAVLLHELCQVQLHIASSDNSYLSYVSGKE